MSLFIPRIRSSAGCIAPTSMPRDSNAVESKVTVTAVHPPPGAGPPTAWVKYIRIVTDCSGPATDPPSNFIEFCCSSA